MDFLLIICAIAFGPLIGLALLNYSEYIEYKNDVHANQSILFTILFVLAIGIMFFLLVNFH